MKRCGFLLFAIFIASLSSASTFVRHADELPGWAVKYGGEFWFRPAGLDFADVAERVSLALGADDRGVPRVQGPGFSAAFTESGFVFSAKAPPPSGAAPVDTLVRTVAIRQGGEVLCRPGALNWVVCGNTAQARLDSSAAIIQHCEATRTGVEVAWIFPVSPRVEDLTIETSVGGLPCAAETDSGHHFADADGTARVRVGRAEAVDSAGRRWELETRAAGNGLVIEVPAAVLAEAVYPLAIDPAVSAEFGMNNLRVPAPAEQDQTGVRIAWGGTNYLAVWQDNRSGDWSDYDYSIFGARISAAGQVVDPYGIAICVQPGPQQEPGVGWNGTGWYVAWEDVRGMTNYLIYGTRIGSDGAVLDAGGRLIGSVPPIQYQQSPWVATRTGSVLVVWEDMRTGRKDVYGRLVDTSGSPVGSSDFYICNATNNQQLPVAAWGATNYLVAWEDLRNDNDEWDYTDIYGARVGPDGTLMDTSSLAIGVWGSTYQKAPSVAWGISNFLVVWEDSRNVASTSRYDVYGARVSSGGQIVDPSHFPVSGYASNQLSPCATWGGTNFFVVWSDVRRGNTSDLFAARVSESGRVLDSNGMAICSLAGNQSLPSAAWNGSQFLVAWQTDMNADYRTHLYAGRVTETGGVLDAAGILLSRGGNSQTECDAAWGRTNWLVVWRDNLDWTTSDLYGARVGAAGTVLDPAGLAICAATNKQRDPAVAWGGTNFLVVWSDDRNLASNANEFADLYGARVSDAGQILDANGIVICTNLGPQAVPDVACGTSGVFLVVWEDYLTYTNGTTYYGDIAGTRVNAAGTVLDPGYSLIPISTATNNQYSPEIAAGPMNFLVAWEDRRNGLNYSIYAARVDAARNVLDPSAIAVGVGTTNSVDPDVAWGGTNFLVVWQDFRGSSQGWSDIYAGRVSAAGGVLDGSGGFSLCTETNIQSDPVVGWSGTNFLAVWVNENVEPNSLWGSRIDGGGHVLDPKDPGGFELFTNRVRRVDATLAPRSNGLFLVAHHKFRAEGYNAFRVFSALLDLAPPALRVVSPHGTGSPGVGTNYYVHGTPLSCAILDSPVTGGDTQWVCSGWAGTGSAPGGSGTNTGVFALDSDSTVTWLWTTNYRLSVAIGGRGSANWTNGWVKYASNVTVTAANGPHFYFNGWQGSVPAGNTNNNPLTVTMSVPRLAIANFAPYLATNRVPHWWLAEHSLATNDTAAMADDDNDFQKTWEEWIAFTDPTNRESSFVLFTGMGVETTITVTISGTLTDRVYDVLSGTNLNTAGTWTARGLNVPGTGSNLTFVISNASPQAFHRFSVTLP